MTTQTHEKPTAADHAAQDLAKAIAKLRTSEGFQAWLKAKQKMPTYSFLNQIRVWIQDPDATLVRGKRQWREDFHRAITEYHPIWILAPITKKTGQVTEAGEEERKTFFKAVRVFDVRYTTPDPLETEIPLVPPVRAAEITGDSHVDWIEPLCRHAIAIGGHGVNWVDTGPKGSYSPSQKIIQIRDDLEPNEQVHVLVHELAHAHADGPQRSTGHDEACTEAAAFIACAAIGLDVAASSVPYIAGWQDSDDDVIAADAKRIHTIANAIAGCRDD